MEVFVSDFGSNPEKVDLERKNDESSVNVRRQVVNEIFDTSIETALKGLATSDNVNAGLI